MHSSYLKGEEPRQLLEKRMREEGRLPTGQSASLKESVSEVVADTSPLVALHQISLLGILRALFGVLASVDEEL